MLSRHRNLPLGSSQNHYKFVDLGYDVANTQVSISIADLRSVFNLAGLCVFIGKYISIKSNIVLHGYHFPASGLISRWFTVLPIGRVIL